MAKPRKKTGVPKRIAGAKVPKSLRRGLKRLAKSQDGKTVVAEALLAAGAALAVHQLRPGSRTRAAAETLGNSVKGKVATREAAAAFRESTLVTAFASAIGAFTESLRSHAPPQPTPAEGPEGAGPPH